MNTPSKFTWSLNKEVKAWSLVCWPQSPYCQLLGLSQEAAPQIKLSWAFHAELRVLSHSLARHSQIWVHPQERKPYVDMDWKVFRCQVLPMIHCSGSRNSMSYPVILLEIRSNPASVPHHFSKIPLLTEASSGWECLTPFLIDLVVNVIWALWHFLLGFCSLQNQNVHPTSNQSTFPIYTS